MKHLNGKNVLAIDLRLSGDDPQQHQIIEIGALLLDHHFDVVQTMLPFQMLIRPSSAGAISENVSLSKETMLALAQYGKDHFDALDMFCNWLDRLPQSTTKYGTPKKIVLLGHSLPIQVAFLLRWMGAETFHTYFHEDMRDIQTCGLFMNDLTGSKMERVPFSKTTLNWIASKHNVEYKMQRKDVIHRLRVIASTYSRLCWNSNIM